MFLNVESSLFVLLFSEIVCHDESNECDKMKSEGKCTDRWKKWMKSFCYKTCGYCGRST